MSKPLRYFILILLLITVISTASYCSAPYDTETAHIITVKNTISGGGYILRGETIIETESSGIFEPSVQSGTRVSKGSTVGISTTGNLDEGLARKLEDVTQRINEIKQSESISDLYASDEARIFAAMRTLSEDIRENIRTGDFMDAAKNTAQLAVLVEKKHFVENGSAADQLLVELEAEKYNLEQKIGGVRKEVIAPQSGYFHTTLDGLENKVSVKDIPFITNADIKGFESTLKSFDRNANEAGKITDSYEWYLVASLPNEDLGELKSGQEITLSIDESEFVRAQVLSINPDSTDYSAVIIRSDRELPGIYEKRTAQFEICIAEHTGLYVPSAAIRVQDDVTGVYVMNRTNEVVFKCVKILMEEPDYYIVQTDYEPAEDCPFEALRTYDNILVNPEVSDVDSKSSEKPE